MYLAPARRVSPVPNLTFHTFRHPYAGEFLGRCCFKIFPLVYCLRQAKRGSALTCLAFTRGLTTRQCSLYATDCVFARPLSEPLSLGFNAGISPGLRLCIEVLRRQSATERLDPYSDRTYTG